MYINNIREFEEMRLEQELQDEEMTVEIFNKACSQPVESRYPREDKPVGSGRKIFTNYPGWGCYPKWSNTTSLWFANVMVED